MDRRTVRPFIIAPFAVLMAQLACGIPGVLEEGDPDTNVVETSQEAYRATLAAQGQLTAEAFAAEPQPPIGRNGRLEIYSQEASTEVKPLWGCQAPSGGYHVIQADGTMEARCQARSSPMPARAASAAASRICPIDQS